MNLVNRLQLHYGWTPSYRLVSKKPAPLEPNIQVPQTIGIMGWIVLSHENGIPTCWWITERESQQLKICLDERLFGDTILRVEKVKNDYIIADIWLYNSNCIFKATTFKQRYEWLPKLIQKMYTHVQGFANIIHKSEMKNVKIRGYEIYDDKEGSSGCYAEDNDSVSITKTDIPDVYLVDGHDGYVLVPNLKTSIFLRSKGSSFKLRCVQKEGNWEITEDIPEVK
jgi:hypothetical protein